MQYVVLTNDPFESTNYSRVDFGEFVGFDQHTDVYGTLMLNTHMEDVPLNGFLRLSWERQSLVDIPVTTNPDVLSASYTSILASFTPGIVLSAGPLHHLMIGVQFIHDVSVKTGDTWLPPFTVVGIQY